MVLLLVLLFAVMHNHILQFCVIPADHVCSLCEEYVIHTPVLNWKTEEWGQTKTMVAATIFLWYMMYIAVV